MSASFDLDAPDHFTTGAVGPVGERVFYIQGRQKGRLVTLKSEKEQVRALATYLAQILDKLPTASEPTPQSLDLVEPVDAAWPVASLGLGWDEKRQRIVVVAESVVDEEGAGDGPLRDHARPGGGVRRAHGVAREGGPADLPHVQPAQGSRRPRVPAEQRPRRHRLTSPRSSRAAR